MSRRIQDIPAPRVAAIYCRVSSQQQSTEDKVSLATQDAEGRVWCAARGWAVENAYVYHEVHSGEDLWERKVLQQLLEDAKSRRFGLVLSHSVDRLSRDKTAVHLGIITDQLDRAGVTYDFTTEAFESSPLGFLTMQIRGFAAGIENERKRERVMRATRAKAVGGAPIPGGRCLYGYQWGPERAPSGKLAKKRLLPDPITAPIVVRIYEAAAAGKTIRRIAIELTEDGIPTPTRRRAGWAPGAVHDILAHPTYWGQAAALRWQAVPVEKHLRSQYAKKSRHVKRAVSEQIPLPERCAPALVSAQLAAAATQRLAFNQRTAIRNNRYPERSLLRGGFARCGDCRTVLGVKTTSYRRANGKGDYLRTRYFCVHSRPVDPSRPQHTIEAHTLDDAAWAKLCEVLRNPQLIEHEVERMRGTPAPGTDALAGIDERLVKLARRLANLRRLAEDVDDPDQTRQLAQDIASIAVEKRATEAERVAAVAHYATWQDQQDGLESTLDTCRRWGQNLDASTYDEKRAILAALKVTVWLYGTAHTPRAEMEIRLPLSGALTFTLGDSVRKREMFRVRPKRIISWGLEGERMSGDARSVP